MGRCVRPRAAQWFGLRRSPTGQRSAQGWEKLRLRPRYRQEDAVRARHPARTLPIRSAALGICRGGMNRPYTQSLCRRASGRAGDRAMRAVRSGPCRQLDRRFESGRGPRIGVPKRHPRRPPHPAFWRGHRGPSSRGGAAPSWQDCCRHGIAAANRRRPCAEPHRSRSLPRPLSRARQPGATH